MILNEFRQSDFSVPRVGQCRGYLSTGIRRRMEAITAVGWDGEWFHIEEAAEM